MSDSTAAVPATTTTETLPPLPDGFTRGSGKDAGTFYYQGKRIEGMDGDHLILEQPQIGPDAQQGSVVGVSPETAIDGSPLVEWLQEPGVQATIGAEVAHAEESAQRPQPQASVQASVQAPVPSSAPAVPPHSNGASEPGYVEPPQHIDGISVGQHQANRLHAILDSIEGDLGTAKQALLREVRILLADFGIHKIHKQTRP